QARRQSDLRAAERTFGTGLADAEAGLIDRGLFTMLEALRLAPEDAADFRRVVRTNLAAWGDHLPVLRHVLKGHSQAAFVGTDGKTFATLSENPYHRWDVASGRPIGSPAGRELPVSGREGWWATLAPDGRR